MRRICLQEARAGRGQVYPDNGRSRLMICLLVKQHVEAGGSGPALALLSINHSAASASQPSILDREDSNYFNCATRREKHVYGVVVSAEEGPLRSSSEGLKKTEFISSYSYNQNKIFWIANTYVTHVISLCYIFQVMAERIRRCVSILRQNGGVGRSSCHIRLCH